MTVVERGKMWARFIIIFDKVRLRYVPAYTMIKCTKHWSTHTVKMFWDREKCIFFFFYSDLKLKVAKCLVIN